jgi:hypothetical protein
MADAQPRTSAMQVSTRDNHPVSIVVRMTYDPPPREQPCPHATTAGHKLVTSLVQGDLIFHHRWGKWRRRWYCMYIGRLPCLVVRFAHILHTVTNHDQYLHCKSFKYSDTINGRKQHNRHHGGQVPNQTPVSEILQGSRRRILQPKIRNMDAMDRGPVPEVVHKG